MPSAQRTMSSVPNSAHLSRQEILVSMRELSDSLVLEVVKKLEALAKELQCSGSNHYVNAAVDNLVKAKNDVGSAISALGAARGSLEDEQEECQGRYGLY